MQSPNKENTLSADLEIGAVDQLVLPSVCCRIEEVHKEEAAVVACDRNADCPC